jgi:hypothetical protein
MHTLWNPPLFSSGSLLVANRYETIRHGVQWSFELFVTWLGEAITLNQEKIERFNQDGNSQESFSIVSENAGYRITYSAHLEIQEDIRDVQWSAQLVPYTGDGMPYLGMWQILQSEYSFRSTAQERLLKQQLYDQRKESVIGFALGIAFLAAVLFVLYLIFML